MTDQPTPLPNTTKPIVFIPDAWKAINAESEASGHSGTDVTNRAVQLYHFIMEKARAGNKVQFVGEDGAVETLHID